MDYLPHFGKPGNVGTHQQETTPTQHIQSAENSYDKESILEISKFSNIIKTKAFCNINIYVSIKVTYKRDSPWDNTPNCSNNIEDRHQRHIPKFLRIWNENYKSRLNSFDMKNTLT